MGTLHRNFIYIHIIMASFTATTTQLTQFSAVSGQFKNRTVAKAAVNNTVVAEDKVKVAINGFGRIGRNFVRCWKTRGADCPLQVVCVNQSGGAKPAAHLLKYDSILGTFKSDVKVIDDKTISVDGDIINVVAERDPLKLPWKELGIDIVIEGTGVFLDGPGAGKHLTAGAKKVVITAPAKVTRSRPTSLASTRTNLTRLPTLSPTPRAPPTAWRRSPRFWTKTSASSRVP